MKRVLSAAWGATFFFGLTLMACGPQPPPNPKPPDPNTDVYATACVNLKAIDCPEGKDPECANVLKHGDEKLSMHPACLAAAKSPDDARACKSVRCQKGP